MKIAGKLHRIKDGANARAEHNVVFILIMNMAFIDEGQRNLYGAAKTKTGRVD